MGADEAGGGGMTGAGYRQPDIALRADACRVGDMSRRGLLCDHGTSPGADRLRIQSPGALCIRVLWDQGFVHRENGSLSLTAHRSTPSGLGTTGCRMPPVLRPQRGRGTGFALQPLEEGRRDAGGLTAVDAPQAGLAHPQIARAETRLHGRLKEDETMAEPQNSVLTIILGGGRGARLFPLTQ